MAELCFFLLKFRYKKFSIKLRKNIKQKVERHFFGMRSKCASAMHDMIQRNIRITYSRTGQCAVWCCPNEFGVMFCTCHDLGAERKIGVKNGKMG
jgi:hypothetical protein